MLAKKKIGSVKKTSLENFVIGSQCGGFQFMLILDPWGISFHPAVVVGLGNDLLFNSILGHCEMAAELFKNLIHKISCLKWTLQLCLLATFLIRILLIVEM